MSGATPALTPASSLSSSSSDESPDRCSGGNKSIRITFRWLSAIHDATHCLRRTGSFRGRRIRNNASAEELEYGIQYLSMLEQSLEKEKASWNTGPSIDPPPFTPYCELRKEKDGNKKSRKDAWKPVSSTSIGVFRNRFALLDDDDDEEHERNDADEDTYDAASFLLDQEAGDVPLLNCSIMTMRRIMIRVLTAQSELFLFQARLFRRNQSCHWSLGAEKFQASLSKIKQGLELANSEVSRCLVNDKTLRLDRPGLMEDADIMEIAARSLTEDHEAFVQEALARKHRLMQVLAEHELQRQRARKRLGDKVWFGNRIGAGQSPQAKQRLLQQLQALDVEAALKQSTSLDARSALHSAIKLKLRIKELPTQASPDQDPTPDKEEDDGWAKVETLTHSNPTLGRMDVKVIASARLYMMANNELKGGTSEVEIRYQGVFWLEQNANTPCFRLKFQAYEVVNEAAVGALSRGSIEFPLPKSAHNHWQLVCLNEENAHVIRLKFPGETTNSISKIQLCCPRNSAEASAQAVIMFETLKECEMKCRHVMGRAN